MAHTAGRPATRAQGRLAGLAGLGTRPGGRRHPLVAAVMVLPLAVLLAVVFGGVDEVITQASSVAGLLGF
jgi:phosphotransferase system  glucose/maltose/N-acetylglucosamine-specific IIC component